MQNINSLKNAFVWMAMFFVGIFVSFTVVGCSKDEVTGHDNNGDAVMSVKATKHDTTPDPVFRNDTIPAFRNDSVIVVINYYKNDTIIDKKNYGALVSASISREFDKLQTTEARLANLDFTFGEVSSSTNGKNQVVGKQDIQDGDGQNYTGQTTSGKIFNIYAELVTFKKTNLQNEALEPGKDEAKLVNTKIQWTPVVRIVNAPNLAGQEFELTTNSTEHLRYILKNAPEFVKYDDWNIWKETGNWSTIWHFECNEYWSNDSVAPKSKLATLKGSYSRKDLDDKTVSGFDYTHPAGDLKWGNYAEIESKDAGVKLFEKKGTKKAYATNGFDADKFDTEFTVTMQKADVMFCDSLFHVESDEATLTNQRNVFVDEYSDRDGYSMVRFTDSEVAKWAGEYDQKLDETCKLYLKAAEPEIITEGWDKFNFETDAKEYTDRVEYFLKWIKEYSDGKKTSTDIKVVLQRSAEGSSYTITVDDPQREIGEVSEEVPTYIARTESASDIVINYDWKTSSFELPNVFDGNKTENDIATFVDPDNVKVTKKNSKGEDVTIELPSFEHQLTSTVSELEKVSESDELVEYTYTRTWSWASTQCTSTANSFGFINKIPEGGEPDFDLEIGSIFATVSRPSNRDASDITAYTYLLVSKDGTKCLPLGFYNGVITVDEKNGIVDYVSGMNSACYVKNENKVVATTASLASGIIKYKDANGNMVDGGMFLTWQGAGFNDRGNDYVNHTGKYAPKAEKKGNVYVVTFEGTNVSYTFKGWDVK